MNQWIKRIGNAYAFTSVTGIWWYLWFETYRYLTRPKLWNRFLIKRIRGRKLAKSLGGFPSFSSPDLVSVVLPVNNGRTKGVEKLVRSLQSQSHAAIEYIAIDSGSTDDTVAWLRQEGFQVAEIAPKDFTHAYSRNKGASLAKGKYLLFVVDDVVFDNPDWLRSAIFLLEKFNCDSLSSRQTIDEHADAYARVLDKFLSTGQSDTLTVALSKSNFFANWLHKILPLHSQFHSVAIDDTNHLVRKDAFDRHKFRAPTVEDIEFALRLTAAGGRTIYTNFLTVRHYHTYTADALLKYAKRVYIDSNIISKWQPYMIRFESREAFLVAGVHSLAIFLQAFKELDNEMSSLGESHRKFRSAETASGPYVDALIRITEVLDSTKYRAMKYRGFSSFHEARDIFVRVFGEAPPADFYRNEVVSGYLIRRIRNDMALAKTVIFQSEWQLAERDEVKTVMLYLWVNRMMSHMARDSVFEKIEIRYPCESWDISVWS
jgi:glycosyltransferase involved in cell wall biosynthesis